MRRRAILSIGSVAVAAAVAGPWAITSSGGAAADSGAGTPAEVDVDTATVTRGTLRQSERVQGTLGFGDVFALPGVAAGTVTWVPDTGTILEPGDLLYRVDERPTYWAHGKVPSYRPLARGDRGADVEQLQRFLQDQGNLDADEVVDGSFDATLVRAVKSWQDAHGVDETGVIDASQLLFLPYDGLRVATAPRVGDPAQGGVLDVTLDEVTVTTEVNAAQKRAFKDAEVIEVELADGSRHPATVDGIEAVSSQGGQQVFRVDLTVDADASEQPGTVSVEVTDVLVDGVLLVPVSALLARTEGGYAVEVVDSDGSRDVREVEIGEFADGLVAVTGDLSEGDRVVVPS